MILVWAGVVLVGLTTAMLASRKAVEHASAVAFGTGIPPFVIGITLVSIGTDLPEIANSIIASVAGHGDLNVGDSVGSALAQITLVLGLLPFVAGRIVVGRARVLAPGIATLVALGVLSYLVSDDFLSRADGALLVLLWLVMSAVIWKTAPQSEPSLIVPTRRKSIHGVLALTSLGVIGVGAGAAVWAFIEIAEALGAPEFFFAFFGTAIGTSLPEMMVDITALRRGERDLAVGGVFGSSLVDSTLSVGIGPLIAPTVITGSLALRSIGSGLFAVSAVVLLLARTGRHTRVTGITLILIYVALYPVVLL